MTRQEQLEHATDLKARIGDVVTEMENWPKTLIDPYYVATRLFSILSRANDAVHEIRCREADRMLSLGITGD